MSDPISRRSGIQAEVLAHIVTPQRFAGLSGPPHDHRKKELMTRTLHLFTSLSISLVTVGSVALAHENDPKRNPEPPVYGDILYGDRDGIAGAWGGSQENTIFCAQVPINMLGGSGSGSDCWGYTSPSGREYAIIGIQSAIAWVEVTDPFAPSVVYTYQRGGTSSLWCDVKVIGSRAYAVGESGGSIKTFDMANIDRGVVNYIGESSANGNSSTHNIAAVPEANLLIKCGGSGEGLRFYSTAGNPDTPAFIGAWNDRYVHDADIVIYPQDGPDSTYRGRLIGFLNDGNNGGGSNTGLSIVDFGTPNNVNPAGVLLSRVVWPNAGYSHQSWHTEDFEWVISNDETSLNSTWQMIRITDLNNATLGQTQSLPMSANNHNNYVHNGLVYAANYTAGIRILERNGNFLNEIAHFDTYPSNDSSGYNGAWSVYPFFESGTIIASDFQSGLLIFKLDIAPIGFSFPDGLPETIPSSGADVFFSISEGGAEVDFATMAYSFLSDGNAQTADGILTSDPGVWSFRIPSSPDCPDSVSFEFSATTTTGEVYQDNSGPHLATVADGEVVLVDFDGSSGTGWTFGVAGDTAANGVWEQGFPECNGRGDPCTDGSGASNGGCFLTEINPADSNSDIDGGLTTLVSPVFDGLGPAGTQLSYQRWYSNDAGASPGEDSMQVYISNDAGGSWTLVEDVNENANAWVTIGFVIEDVIAPTSQMQMRFVASDLNAGSVVEAGIDNLRVFGIECDDSIPGDLNGDGLVDGADVGLFLAVWGTSDPAADLNGNGTVGGDDLGILLANWSF